MKLNFFLSVLFATAYYGYAQEKHKNNSIKAMIIREIMRKVSNITLNSLSKVAEDKKELVLNRIEQKLRKTASGLTDGQKYVRFIMDEFRNKAFNKTVVHEVKKEKVMIKQSDEKESIETESKENESTEDISDEQKTDVLRTGMDSKEADLETVKPATANRKIFDNQTKEHIIKDISNKIESMAKGYLRVSQTFEQKQRIFEKIKQRILDSSKRKHMLIHDQHNELKAYTNLITQGLEMSMKKLLLETNARRMAAPIEPDFKVDTADKNTYASNIERIEEYKTFFTELWNDTDPRCNVITEEICNRIGSLHKLTCGDGKIISIKQLCDGVSDCWNGVDETNCTIQAMGKSRLAITLISDLDQSLTSECFRPSVRNSLFLHHHEVVRKMLEEQLKLLYKYKGLRIRTKFVDKEDDDDDIFIKKLMSDVTSTVSSLSDAFDVTLCSPRDEVVKKVNITRKSIDPNEVDFIDDESIHAESHWLPKSCVCKNQYCKLSNCDVRCNRICWQKYSLNKWQCQAITGNSTISLDFLCDGKLDCFDESDETSCTADPAVTKYEANALYKELLDLLSLKSLSMEFEQSRNRVVAQTGLLRQLQKLTTKFYVDVHAIKIVRDDFFNTLVHIFEDMLQVSKLEELDEIYEYLHTLNEKIITALKLSHTGNEHIVAPAGCYCNNGTCALVRCSRKCNATCLIEPMLIKYPCNDNNTSVQLKAVCNGKNDCPNEEDEKDCQKEICRAHHLVVLRHNLQKAGVTLKGSALGDILDNWKAKVMSSLIVAQGNERPNHKMLEDIVIKVLRDLVTTYATMEETKRSSSDFIINQFVNMSAIVKQTLKYCNK